jgi:hypothetical protein
MAGRCQPCCYSRPPQPAGDRRLSPHAASGAVIQWQVARSAGGGARKTGVAEPRYESG